jgi:tetratricopeptide (TPR) repeat protein
MPAPEPASIRPRLVAFSACACLVLTSLAPSLAAGAPAEGAAAPNENAEAIFRRGQAKYETADYNGAIELWTEAYALVDSTPENASIKALLIYNLAQAHVKAYELDEDPIHLKQAQQLLQSFRANLSLLYEDQAQLDEEVAKVDERLAEIDEILAAREDEPDEPDEPEPTPEEPPPPVVEPPGEDPGVDTTGRSGTPLLAAGGAALGLGAAFGVVGLVGALMGSSANDISELDPLDLEGRAQHFNKGRTGNTLLIVGAVGAGILIPTGVALLVVGAKRNKAHKRANAAARFDPHLGASWGGAWGQGGGLTLSGRF